MNEVDSRIRFQIHFFFSFDQMMSIRRSIANRSFRAAHAHRVSIHIRHDLFSIHVATYSCQRLDVRYKRRITRPIHDFSELAELQFSNEPCRPLIPRSRLAVGTRRQTADKPQTQPDIIACIAIINPP
jgi:hypothetical protein